MSSNIRKALPITTYDTVLSVAALQQRNIKFRARVPAVLCLGLLLVASFLKAGNQAPEAGCQQTEAVRRMHYGMWTYVWYSQEQADALRAAQQPLSCLIVDGQKRSYTSTTTTGSPAKEAPAATLVTRLRPIPVPTDAYYWYSAEQAQYEGHHEEWHCVRIGGTLHRYTEATVGPKAAGNAPDYRLIGKANTRNEAACPLDSSPHPLHNAPADSQQRD